MRFIPKTYYKSVYVQLEYVTYLVNLTRFSEVIMLGRHNFERPIDFSSSPIPQIAPSSQNSVSSQAESRVPATPKYVCHDRSFDQNVPSTPFTNLALSNITAARLRETDVSHFTPSCLIKHENVSNFSRTGDQLVPLTPEGYRQNTNTSISNSQNQDFMPSTSFQDISSYNPLKKPSSPKSRGKLSIKKNVQQSSRNAGFYITEALKHSDSKTCDSSALSSSKPSTVSTNQFEMNKLKEESTQLFHSHENSLPGPSSVPRKTQIEISRAEVTNIRRSLFNLHTSSPLSSYAANIDNLFSGDDIFL